MKKFITLLMVFAAHMVFGQKTIEKSIGEFSELKVYDLIEVELIKSQENKVVISGQNKSNVVINNKNGKLKIRMSLDEIFDGAKTKVKLYYTSLDVIDVNEGSDLFSNDTIKQFELELRAQEGGSINISADVNYLIVKAVTGGVIQARGKSISQDISLFTGGVYKGKDLESEKTEVTIKVAGEASIYASKVVDAKVRAGGDIYIYGNPETVNESKALGGRIKRMD